MSWKGALLAALLGMFGLPPWGVPTSAKNAMGPLPDLVVARLSNPPKVGAAGKRIKLLVRVRNRGTARAAESRIGIYIVPKRMGRKRRGSGRRLKRAKVRDLSRGESTRLKLRLRLPTDSRAGVYQLIACADDTRRLRESREGDNCHASTALRLTVKARRAPTNSASAPSPERPAIPSVGRPAFTTSDGLSWGFAEDAQRHEPAAGDPVTATLKTANGLAGQAGYTRSEVAAEPLLGGSTTALDFGTHLDNGAVTVELPFYFPFGGIDERLVSVSTNGWVEFGGSPAFDYWGNHQTSDYRGVGAVMGNLERGIMPYMGDLDLTDLGAGAGNVTTVVARDADSVAFQWDVGQHNAGGGPRRVFQLVLLPDGSFRFDYPDATAPGGPSAFIGYTLGTSTASAMAVATDTKAVPTSSFLFTPRQVPSAAPLPNGIAALTLPTGSSFVSGDEGCAVVNPPSPLGEGLVSCSIPSLAAGAQATRSVTFSMPPNAAGWTRPANFRYVGSYLVDELTLTDGDEVDALERSLEDTSLEVDVQFVSGAPEVGTPARFEADVSAAGGGMDEAEATFTLPEHTRLDSIEISGQEIPCSPADQEVVTCALPSGARGSDVLITVVPERAASGAPMRLVASADALNASPDTAEATSPGLPALEMGPILFVHGYAGSAAQWDRMIERFEADGWPSSYLRAYTYDTSQSNVTDAETEVWTHVEQLLQETGARKVDIIAHSMGSLNTRWYIKELHREDRVDDWVSLGGPNHGTTTASLCALTSCLEMRPGSSFLSALNAGDETPGPVNYGTWWSPCDGVINPDSSVSLEGAANHEAPCTTHTALLTNVRVYEEVRDFVD